MESSGSLCVIGSMSGGVQLNQIRNHRSRCATGNCSLNPWFAKPEDVGVKKVMNRYIEDATSWISGTKGQRQSCNSEEEQDRPLLASPFPRLPQQWHLQFPEPPQPPRPMSKSNSKNNTSSNETLPQMSKRRHRSNNHKEPPQSQTLALHPMAAWKRGWLC